MPSLGQLKGGFTAGKTCSNDPDLSIHSPVRVGVATMGRHYMITRFHRARPVRATRMIASTMFALLLSCFELAAQAASTRTTSDEAWWEDPCVAIERDSTATGTRVALEGVSFLAPAGLRVAARQPFEVALEDGRATMRVRLAPDANVLFRQFDQPGLRYKYCQGELAGRMAEVFSFQQQRIHGFAVLWPQANRDESLAIVIYSLSRAKTGQLRNVLATLQFPK
jgi:hypothetical protein